MLKKLAGLHNSGAAGRAALNTVVIYIQRFFAAGLGLVTTPIILNALGVTDYGIYGITMGFVAVLNIVNWSLSSSTQRYTAFAIGENNFDKVKNVYSTASIIHFIYGLLFLSVIFIISHFFVEHVLNIPENRIDDTKKVLYIVGCITFIGIIQIPLTGVLRAYENFLSLAIVGITESVLKLGIALLIVGITGDKLIIYAVLLLAITVISYCIYLYIVSKKYKLVFTIKRYDKILVKDMMSFLSWSFLGAVAISSRNEGVQLLINIFFGVTKNAAYFIAMQVNSAMSILGQGIGSMAPQIIKSAAAGEYDKMIFLMRTMSKFAIFTVSVVAIPIFFECPFILQLWLKTVPESTVTYVRLIIVFAQVMLLSAGIQTVFDALGKVKLYNIYVSLILILNLPVAYVFFKMGYSSHTIIIVGICLEFISLIVRVYLLKKYVNLSAGKFFYDAVFRVFMPLLVVSGIIYSLRYFNLNPYINLAITILITVTIYPLIVYKFSLEDRQKELIKGIFNRFLPSR